MGRVMNALSSSSYVDEVTVVSLKILSIPVVHPTFGMQVKVFHSRNWDTIQKGINLLEAQESGDYLVLGAVKVCPAFPGLARQTIGSSDLWSEGRE